MTQDIQFQLNEGPLHTHTETYTYIGLWNMDERKRNNAVIINYDNHRRIHHFRFSSMLIPSKFIVTLLYGEGIKESKQALFFNIKP